MSPRERAYAPQFLVGAVPGEGSRVGQMVKTVGLFALIAVPVGFLISSAQSRKQLEDEKAAFRRVGLDWNQRYQHPK